MCTEENELICIYHCIRENVNEGKEGIKKEKKETRKEDYSYVSVGKEKTWIKPKAMSI